MVIYKVIYIYCCSQSYIYCWKYKNSPIMNFTSWRREAHLFIWFRKPSYQQTFYLHIYTHKGYTCICIICVLIRFCNILYQDLISLSPSLDKRLFMWYNLQLAKLKNREILSFSRTSTRFSANTRFSRSKIPYNYLIINKINLIFSINKKNNLEICKRRYLSG